MVGRVIAWLREWIAVEDPEERIEGSGEAITSPQHRRSPAAECTLEELDDDADEHRHDDP